MSPALDAYLALGRAQEALHRLSWLEAGSQIGVIMERLFGVLTRADLERMMSDPAASPLNPAGILAEVRRRHAAAVSDRAKMAALEELGTWLERRIQEAPPS